MGHSVEQSAYRRLSERLNRFPQGAPPSKLLTNKSNHVIWSLYYPAIKLKTVTGIGKLPGSLPGEILFQAAFYERFGQGPPGLCLWFSQFFLIGFRFW